MPVRRQLLLRPLPSVRAFTPVFDGLCGERAALIVQQTRSGEGARPAPHPVLSLELSNMPSPQHKGVHARLRRAMRGEGASTSAQET
jgi:hypothetical protein